MNITRQGVIYSFANWTIPQLRVTIPFHRKDLAPKTLQSIIKQANLTVEEFIALL